MNVGALVIASLSLIVSAMALYLSFFRRPSLSAHVGPYIVVIYDKKGLSITVPTTVANQANQVGVVRRCSLTFTRADALQQNFYMAWDSFRRITDDGSTWIQSGVAHAIPVLGRSNKTHNIQYIWETGSRPELNIAEGTYHLRFDFWSERATPFTSVVHELRVSAEEARRLNATKVGAAEGGRVNHGVVYLTLDQETMRNRVMTQHEMARLLC